MLGVKLTILLIFLTVLYIAGLRFYHTTPSGREAALKEIATNNYSISTWIGVAMIILDVIGLVYSAVYLLFFH